MDSHGFSFRDRWTVSRRGGNPGCGIWPFTWMETVEEFSGSWSRKGLGLRHKIRVVGSQPLGATRLSMRPLLAQTLNGVKQRGVIARQGPD
jgi:hypothetical protein